MNKRAKRFERILVLEQQYYTFAEVRNFLEYYGFEAKKKGSSHFVFRRQDYPHITIVVHWNRVKNVYVKDAVKVLRNFNLIP